MTANAETDWRQRIESAQRLIESRLDEDIPLEELAAAVHASVFHFHRVFRGMTGETPREFGWRLRLERAADRLMHGADDILAVALEAGYESHEAFSRAFKRRFGITPSEFRANAGQPAQHQEDRQVTSPLVVQIEEFTPRRIAFVRHVGPYDTVGAAWKALMKWGWSKMMFGRPETFGLCFDDPDVTPSDQLRYEACMVVGDRAKARDTVQIRTLPAMTCAVTLYAGPLDDIGQAYARLFAHVAAEPVDGRRWSLGDPPSLERYLRDPRRVPPAAMQTEICMPVHPASAPARTPA